MFEHFQAGYSHTVEERERKRREIVQSPSAAPPFGEIDLDSGVVVVDGVVVADARPDREDGTEASAKA